MIDAPRERNNFDVLRLVFAGLVIFSHSFAVAGHPEPVIWGRTLGNLGVHGFFVVSGYLVAQSWLRSSSTLQYAGHRFLRIVPALVVAMVIATLLGLLARGYPNNPIPNLINGPVWTLTWEAICYVLVAVVGLAGALTRRGYPVLFLAAWLVVLVNIANVSDFFLAIVPLLLMFGAGALFAVVPKPIGRGLIIAAAIGLLVSANYFVFSLIQQPITSTIPFLYAPPVTIEQAYRVIYLVSFPIVTVWVGSRSWPGWRLKNDLSYGLYIYAWPISQVIVMLLLRFGLPLSPWIVLVLTAVIVVPTAYLSWRFIEKPALSLKKYLRPRPPPEVPPVTPPVEAS